MSATLQLTPDDAALLREVIAHYLDELKSEIAHTDDYDYREGLHAKERRLTDLVGQLSAS